MLLSCVYCCQYIVYPVDCCSMYIFHIFQRMLSCIDSFPLLRIRGDILCRIYLRQYPICMWWNDVMSHDQSPDMSSDREVVWAWNMITCKISSHGWHTHRFLSSDMDFPGSIANHRHWKRTMERLSPIWTRYEYISMAEKKCCLESRPSSRSCCTAQCPDSASAVTPSYRILHTLIHIYVPITYHIICLYTFAQFCD
jgi:hypothetical protein